MSKIMILAAGIAGYVLGAKAGHQRYEQIAGQAQRVWKDPRVQEKTSQVASAVKDKAPQVKDHLPGRHSAGAGVGAGAGADGDRDAPVSQHASTGPAGAGTWRAAP
ncbi:MAG: YtxH domain-containing protein [Intrasporangium sp.]|uniref:YtxH domain-containing protein n=1 Tax=Intrasporangium sp. TaxID=1925024 RepID=UPI0026477BF0|nr:YtxH domain-containing protein [Intrasporangium sp.]MDN5797637.1 YtxH domain-containing protein [Intrasporangium sp.]